MYKLVFGVMVIGVAGFILSNINGNRSEPNEVLSTTSVDTTTSTTVPAAQPTILACEALTLERAQSVLGFGARLLTSSTEEEVTADVAVTDCVYDEGTNSLTGKTVSLVSRRALSTDGYQFNLSEMEATATQGLLEGEAATTSEVTGLGDAAVWNQDFGQLNVILNEGGYWLTVQIGVGGEDADKAATVELATMVVEAYEY